MIRTLRRKFIMINMLLAVLVVASVFSVLCVSEYRSLREESSAALQMALSRRDGGKPPMLEIGKKPPEDFIRSPVFVVRVLGSGEAELLSADGITVTGSEIAAIVALVEASGRNEGVLDDFNLQYRRSPERDNTRIAFVELTAQRLSFRNTVLLSLLLSLSALAAFFVISLFLSRWALKPAEKAWGQQRRFIADASHELKTPLTVILANTGILKSNRSDTIDAQMQWVENTEAEATRMKQLVDNLLFLAKSDDAREPLVTGDVALSQLVYGTALAFESVAYERGVQLDTDGVGPGIAVTGDEGQLRQLTAILLDNAVKYSDRGGTVSVALKARQSDALLSVHNFGNALSKEDQSHVFERFYRADKSRANHGYGLGLSIAVNIAAAHGGKIWVESTQTEGTTFMVQLPVK